jgi:hypothetical protein
MSGRARGKDASRRVAAESPRVSSRNLGRISSRNLGRITSRNLGRITAERACSGAWTAGFDVLANPHPIPLESYSIFHKHLILSPLLFR